MITLHDQLAAGLNHPHILPVYDSGEASGLLFYVMPNMEGRTLRERLQRERQLPLAEALTITREVASALDYAHRHHCWPTARGATPRATRRGPADHLALSAAAARA